MLRLRRTPDAIYFYILLENHEKYGIIQMEGRAIKGTPLAADAALCAWRASIFLDGFVKKSLQASFFTHGIIQIAVLFLRGGGTWI